MKKLVIKTSLKLYIIIMKFQFWQIMTEIRFQNFLNFTKFINLMQNFFIIFIFSLFKFEITINIWYKIFAQKKLVIKRILNNWVFWNPYLRGPSRGDFFQTCFGTLGHIEKHPHSHFWSNISLENPLWFEHCDAWIVSRSQQRTYGSST